MKTSLPNSSKYPAFIKNHPIFFKIKNIRKIFPHIGLNNCSIKSKNIKLIAEDGEVYRSYLVSKFTRLGGGSKILYNLRNYSGDKFIKTGQLKLPNIFSNINYLYNEFHNYYNDQKDISLKPNYNLINDNTRIVFSSNPWDIATMSMRGISSCQSWRGCYRGNIIGSIIDPFVGIIYITNNKVLGKGKRMLRRALVRYVVNVHTRKPALFLERIYPNDRDSGIIDISTALLFRRFLSNKVNNKLDVITNAAGYKIPGSKEVDLLDTTDCEDYAETILGDDYQNNCKSYRDSGIQYHYSHHLGKGSKSLVF